MTPPRTRRGAGQVGSAGAQADLFNMDATAAPTEMGVVQQDDAFLTPSRHTTSAGSEALSLMPGETTGAVPSTGMAIRSGTVGSAPVGQHMPRSLQERHAASTMPGSGEQAGRGLAPVEAGALAMPLGPGLVAVGGTSGIDAAGGMAGVDEAGRGPLAGPVYAAAVILDPARPIPGLADSKALTAARREALAGQIREHALAWCIAMADVAEIDSLNILHATMLAMRRACLGLPGNILQAQIDGNRVPRDLPFPAVAVVKGDATVAAISAASILAKTARDDDCQRLHALYPQYAFDQHKGYGTALHLERLREHGPCPAHRRSFAPVRNALARETGAEPSDSAPAARHAAAIHRDVAS